MRTRDERRKDIRDKIAEWTHGPDWKTWIAHAVFGIIIAVIVGGIAALLDHPGELYGAAVAIGYYVIREVEQVVYNIVDKKELHPFDHFMDVATPAAFVMAVVGLVYLLDWIF